MMTNVVSTCLLTASFVLILVTIGLFTVAKMRHEPGSMVRPTVRVTATYDGSAAAYRLRNGETLASEPAFKARIINQDEEVFRRHLDNLAARRHWATTEYDYKSVGFMMPDHDVKILRHIAQDPYGWAQELERSSRDMLPKPEHETLMPARVLIDEYQPSRDFRNGAIIAALLATLATLTFLGYGILNISRD